MKKRLKIVLIMIGIVILLLASVFLINFIKISSNNSVSVKDKTHQISSVNGINIKDIPQDFSVEQAVLQNCFVITIDKIYNKDVLDRFIENTKMNATNRVPDSIRIVVYNYDGYPTIYDLQYKIFDETYINAERKEVNKTGYTLTIDATRNNISPKEIKTINDIPGECYSIILTEDQGVCAASISLSLYAEAVCDSKNEPYRDIEVARYALDAELINKE